MAFVSVSPASLARASAVVARFTPCDCRVVFGQRPGRNPSPRESSCARGVSGTLGSGSGQPPGFEEFRERARVCAPSSVCHLGRQRPKRTNPVVWGSCNSIVLPFWDQSCEQNCPTAFLKLTVSWRRSRRPGLRPAHPREANPAPPPGKGAPPSSQGRP